jgi:hypothetical protein
LLTMRSYLLIFPANISQFRPARRMDQNYPGKLTGSPYGI